MRLSITILTLGLLTLTGCARDAGPAVRFDSGPTLDRDGQPRSLVLAPAPARIDAPYAWWQDRNDYARGTYVEYDGLLYDASVQRIHDHTHSSHGRVYDHYHEHSYKQRVRIHVP